MYLTNHYVKKTTFFGSNYIYLQIATKPARNYLPQYAIDFYHPNKLDPSIFSYPNYAMLKFRDKYSNIDDSYNYFKMIIKSADWNVFNNLI